MTTAIERHQPAPLTKRDMQWIDATITQLVSSKSSLVPAALRGKPDDLRLVLTKAAEVGVRQFTTALENFHAVDGRIISSAAIAVAFARRAGHEVWCEEFSADRCTVAGARRGHPDRVTRVTWTLDMAKVANLLNKSNWKSYPAQMLYARASKTWVTMNCPEVLMGLDDGAYFMEDLVDTRPPQAVEIADGLVVAADDDTVDAEIVDTPQDRPFPEHWADRCKTNGIDPATSARILTSVCDVEKARDVPDARWADCDEALDDYLAGALDLGTEA